MPTCSCIAEHLGLCGSGRPRHRVEAAARLAAGFAARDLGTLRK